MTAPLDLHEHALRKLSKVLGSAQAQGVLDAVLVEMGIARVTTLEELGGVAAGLQKRTGFDATVGAMLAVDVAMFRLRSQIA